MVVIRVENLGKKYLIKHEQRQRYAALRDVMASGIKNIGRGLFPPKTENLTPKTTKEIFWALKAPVAQMAKNIKMSC